MPHERILMKYTVMGFSQPKLVELGLDLSDALILRWFVDFYATGRMHKIIAPSGETFVQVNYKAMIEDIPIIGVGSPNNLRRRMSKLVEAGVMEHYTFRSGGTFSCYRLTEAYESLVSGPDNASVGGTPQKAEGYAPKGVGGTPQKAEQKNPSINNHSIKSDIPPTPSRGNDGIDFDPARFLADFNIAANKRCRVITAKTRRQLRARIKEGFSVDEIIEAARKCACDEFHKANPQYLTPEFITRDDKLQKYLYASESTLEYVSDF